MGLISEYVEWARGQTSPLGKLFAYGLPVAAVASIVAGVALNLVPGGSSSSPSQTAAQTRAAQPTATAPVVGLTPSPSPTIPAPPTATATVAAPATYTVVAGDNPTIIARKLGVPEAQQAAWVQQLLTLNNTTDRTIQVGQVLKLPPTTAAAPTTTSTSATRTTTAVASTATPVR